MGCPARGTPGRAGRVSARPRARARARLRAPTTATSRRARTSTRSRPSARSRRIPATSSSSTASARSSAGTRWRSCCRPTRVVRARRAHRQLPVGRDALRGRLQPLLARAVREHGGDLVYIQGHSSPGIYARAFLEGRLTEEHLSGFRQEVAARAGSRSYPHPWLMPDFWQFPTVSMGLGPIMAIYQARFMKYLQDRGIADTAGARCGPSSATARWTSRSRWARSRSPAASSSTTSSSSSTATCSASTARCAATARSSRSSRRSSAAPAGTCSR